MKLSKPIAADESITSFHIPIEHSSKRDMKLSKPIAADESKTGTDLLRCEEDITNMKVGLFFSDNEVTITENGVKVAVYKCKVANYTLSKRMAADNSKTDLLRCEEDITGNSIFRRKPIL